MFLFFEMLPFIAFSKHNFNTIIIYRLDAMVHTCNSSYLGDWSFEEKQRRDIKGGKETPVFLYLFSMVAPKGEWDWTGGFLSSAAPASAAAAPSSNFYLDLASKGNILYTFLHFCYLFIWVLFWDMVSLPSPGYPRSHCEDQIGLELTDPPGSGSHVLELKGRTSIPSWHYILSAHILVNASDSISLFPWTADT